MTAFDKYLDIFILRTAELIEKEDLKNNPEYHNVLTNQLLGLSGPKRITRKMTPFDLFFSKLYTGFNEIHNSYDSLLDIEVYLRRFPYNKTRVSKTRYLAYHMENYLNEVYILKERLDSYCTIVGRLYRNDQTLKDLDLKKAMKDLSAFVQKSLKGITDTRGAHVHNTRFTDENLARLSTMELINYGPKKISLLETLYDSTHRNIRKEYVVAIKQNNERIRIILDTYFEVLYAIVDDKKMGIRYPDSKMA